jgi:hypothetical protein
MVKKNHIGRNNSLSSSRVWTPRSRVPLEKLTVPHPIKKCHLFYGTRRVTTARQWTLSRASYILSTHSICLRYTLIISFCVHLEPVHLSQHCDWATREENWISVENKDFSLLHSARTQPPVQWVSEDLSGEGGGGKLTTLFHLVLRWKIHGAMPPTPHSTSYGSVFFLSTRANPGFPAGV